MTPPPVSAPSPPSPAAPQHTLLHESLLDNKVQAKVVGGGLDLSKVFVYGSIQDGRPKLLYTANRKTQILEPNWVTITHPNVKQTDALLVVVKGEHIGKFALRICHSRRGSEVMALVEIINRVEGSKPTGTGIELHLPADYLAIVYETKEEKKWHTGCMEGRRKQARAN